MGDAVTHMISIALVLLCLCGLSNAYNQQSWGSAALMGAQARASTAPGDILKFTFEFSNHPTSITLNVNYSAPANTNAALYDSGDGVWRPFTSLTIPVVASNKYVAFKGDWRRSGGLYYYMFNSAFTLTNARCRTSGRFAYAPTNNDYSYAGVFNGCTRITSFDDNPFQPITGSPGTQMFYSAFNGMTGVTNLPAGFLDTSGLTGAPASEMFRIACQTMSGVTNLPAGFLDTSGLTGAPAADMFNSACRDMTGVTNLPAGFLNTSGLTGAPAANMFYRACYGMTGVKNLPAGFLDASGLTGAPASGMYDSSCYLMSGVLGGDINMSSNITFATTNITASMSYAFSSMTKWTGTVYWGSSRIYEAITNPATDANVFQNSTNVPGYTTMGGNWK
jgi:hypothetical protein